MEMSISPKSFREVNKNLKGENNGMWKGDKVKYEGLHSWVRNNKPKPEFCEECGIKKPYDLANISGEYKRDINDFEWLCRSCHMKKDGRMNNLKQGCGSGKDNPRWKGGKPKCIDCGKKITFYAQRCKSCGQLNRYKRKNGTN